MKLTVYILSLVLCCVAVVTFFDVVNGEQDVRPKIFKRGGWKGKRRGGWKGKRRVGKRGRKAGWKFRKGGKKGGKGGAIPTRPPTTDDGDDGTFLADAVKRYDCDAKNIGNIFKEARKKKLSISLSEIENEFKGCQKLKAKEETKSDDPDQDEEDTDPPMEITPGTKLIFVDQFKGLTQRDYWGQTKGRKFSKKWMEPLGLFANFYKGSGKAKDWKFKSLIGTKNAMIMSGNFGFTLLKADSRCGDKSKPLGTASTEMQCAERCFGKSSCKFFRYNKKNGQCHFELTQKRDCPLQGFKPMKGFGFYEVSVGPSLSGTGPRMMTTRPFDARNGGNVAFDIVLGEENGYGKCWPTFQKMVAKEKERMQRKQKMLDAKASCESGKSCHGHGKGTFFSKCNSNWDCKMSCTCKCNFGYGGKKCERAFATASCSSTGDPHPVTADGLQFNIYDAGEWLWYKHPASPVEVHLLTRMVTGHIAATAGFAIKKGEDTIILESPHCKNGNTMKIFVKEGDSCKTISSGSSYTTKNSKIQYSGNSIRVDGFNARVGGVWWSRWTHGPCGRHGWLNAYLTIRGPKDGRALGMCGPFNGNRGTDNNVIKRSSGARGHGQWSTSYRNAMRVKRSNSFFRCGVTGMPRFKQLVANQRRNTMEMKAKVSKAMVTAKVAQEMDESMRLMGGDEDTDIKEDTKDLVDKKAALEKCKKDPKIVTADALANCVEDLARTGDNDMVNVAGKQSDEDIEEALETMEENEKDEILELVGEAQLKKPQPMDAVVQYCTSKCLDEKNWKQLKAYPVQVYNDYLTKGFRRMTARIPDNAHSATLQLRFYQKQKKCFCCNPWAIANLGVRSGGWTVAIAADKNFKLFADGKFIGQGEWWEPAKDTFRYRVNPKTKTYAVELDGGNDARMGVIGSFGPSLVTSSTWKCIDKLDAKDTVGNAWMKSTYDDSKWPSAPEEGDNGVLPWGPRPGIAKKAKWIFTHDSYKMKGKKAYCRVNVKDAWHSYSKTHPEASRWSCKQQRDRQSPFVTQLNSETFVSVEIKSGKAASEYQTPGASFTSVKGRDENNQMSEQRVLMHINTKRIVDKTMEGGMIKRTMLRLKVLDPTKNSFIICKVIRKWNAKTVTFKTAPAYDGPASKCRTVRPIGKNNWVAVDVSEWMREWVTNPKENFGMMLFPPGGDNVGFVSQLDPDANERPRLSLSCHGDKVDYDHVFKEKKGSLRHVAKVHK